MKITLTEILLTATALVTTIGVHAQTESNSTGSSVNLASSRKSGSLSLISWSSAKKTTKDSFLCQSASLDLNKSFKSPGT